MKVGLDNLDFRWLRRNTGPLWPVDKRIGLRICRSNTIHLLMSANQPHVCFVLLAASCGQGPAP